ncbi:MAG: L-threonylcarbamoyladenylate synthase [Solirubrobacteraceae bacterium]
MSDGDGRRALGAEEAAALGRCVAGGGVALLPTDTVYGLACDPDDERAIARLHELKGRPQRQPSAVLYGSLSAAEPALAPLAPRTRSAALALLPGPVTLLLPNPAALHVRACDPAGLGGEAPLGIRVPAWPPRLAALSALSMPLMQSSANLSGQTPALRLASVEPSIRRGVDVAVDGGEMPGTASTVIDLSSFERDGAWSIARAGALPAASVAAALRRQPL